MWVLYSFSCLVSPVYILSSLAMNGPPNKRPKLTCSKFGLLIELARVLVKGKLLELATVKEGKALNDQLVS